MPLAEKEKAVSTLADRTGRAAAADVPASLALPEIRLGRLAVSRLILGSNPFFGFSHQGGGADERMKAHYTDERIVAVLEEAAACGVSAVAAPPYERWIALWSRYRREGGRLRSWLAQPDPEAPRMADAIRAAAAGGADAIFVQGERVDEQVRAGRWDVLEGWLELIRGLGLPAGLASHRPDTHPEAERRGLAADFYFQCVYQVDSTETYLPEHRAANLAALRAVTAKPVVAYKVLAAGRLAAREALADAFRHLRPKDGLCVGVYDANRAGQIAEDAALVRELSAGAGG